MNWKLIWKRTRIATAIYTAVGLVLLIKPGRSYTGVAVDLLYLALRLLLVFLVFFWVVDWVERKDRR